MSRKRRRGPFTGTGDGEPAVAVTAGWRDDTADWREDTITSFPAIHDDTPPPAAWLPDDAAEPVFVSDLTQPCPCGSGKTLPECDGRPSPAIPVPADHRALLSCAPGVVSRMWRTRVANGQWENLPALADQAHARVMMPALNRQRAIRGETGARRHDIAAMLARVPSLLADPDLAGSLRLIAAAGERELARQQGDMHREVLLRIAVLRSDIDEPAGAEASAA